MGHHSTNPPHPTPVPLSFRKVSKSSWTVEGKIQSSPPCSRRPCTINHEPNHEQNHHQNHEPSPRAWLYWPPGLVTSLLLRITEEINGYKVFSVGYSLKLLAFLLWDILSGSNEWCLKYIQSKCIFSCEDAVQLTFLLAQPEGMKYNKFDRQYLLCNLMSPWHPTSQWLHLGRPASLLILTPSQPIFLPGFLCPEHFSVLLLPVIGWNDCEADDKLITNNKKSNL